jgi:hypothetical protein
MQRERLRRRAFAGGAEGETAATERGFRTCAARGVGMDGGSEVWGWEEKGKGKEGHGWKRERGQRWRMVMREGGSGVP